MRPEEADTLHRLIEDQERLRKILNDDVLASSQYFQENRTPNNRRATVRAVFACIEGLAYLMRQYALLFNDLFRVEFSPGELEGAEEAERS